MTGLIPVAGVLAGMVSIADTIPYIRDTLRGTTRPHRGTWMIWALLAILACSSQGAGGATWSLIMAATQAVLTSLIVVLAIVPGEGAKGSPSPGPASGAGRRPTSRSWRRDAWSAPTWSRRS